MTFQLQWDLRCLHSLPGTQQSSNTRMCLSSWPSCFLSVFSLYTSDVWLRLTSEVKGFLRWRSQDLGRLGFASMSVLCVPCFTVSHSSQDSPWIHASGASSLLHHPGHSSFFPGPLLTLPCQLGSPCSRVRLSMPSTHAPNFWSDHIATLLEEDVLVSLVSTWNFPCREQSQ